MPYMAVMIVVAPPTSMTPSMTFWKWPRMLCAHSGRIGASALAMNHRMTLITAIGTTMVSSYDCSVVMAVVIPFIENVSFGDAH